MGRLVVTCGGLFPGVYRVACTDMMAQRGTTMKGKPGRPPKKPSPYNVAGPDIAKATIDLNIKLHQQFKDLCRQSGVTPSKALRYFMANSVLAGELPDVAIKEKPDAN